MVDTDVQPEPTKRRKDDEWREKARFAVDIFSRVGMPSIFMLAVMAYTGGVLIGHWPSPFLSSERSERMFIDLTNQQKAIMDAQKSISDTHNIQTIALQDIVMVLKEIRCDHKDSDKSRLRCYQRMNGKD